MAVVMRSASGSVSIGPILIENEPILKLGPIHSPPDTQKSNASGNDEINNDNG